MQIWKLKAIQQIHAEEPVTIVVITITALSRFIYTECLKILYNMLGHARSTFQSSAYFHHKTT